MSHDQTKRAGHPLLVDMDAAGLVCGGDTAARKPHYPYHLGVAVGIAVVEVEARHP